MTLLQQFIISQVCCMILTCVGVWVTEEKRSDVGMVVAIYSLLFIILSFSALLASFSL